jgi:NADPH:quinone reductase-like Zn-dependent oxidoreductase
VRALVQHRYGSPDVLAIEEVADPVPGSGEVLVRVLASSVNARDWHLMRGEPRVARFLDRSVFGNRAPRVRVRGTDFAGVVEAVGSADSDWHVGDRVFGEADCAIAERVVAPADHLATIPDGLTFQQAAALPLAGTTAALCLDAAGATDGQHILNGASGGVGTFAVQLARHRGLHVTAVCSARNTDLVAGLGAQTVIDYREEDFALRADRYDVVLDLVGNRRLRDLRRVLEPGGTLVLSGGGVSGDGKVIGPLALLARAALFAKLTGTRIVVPQATPSAKALEELASLASEGVIAPVVDRVFPLDRAAEAIRYLETEHARAKVVISHDAAAAEVVR